MYLHTADEITAMLFYASGTLRFSIPKLETTLPARLQTVRL
jgi:hypothetical protein